MDLLWENTGEGREDKENGQIKQLLQVPVISNLTSFEK